MSSAEAQVAYNQAPHQSRNPAQDCFAQQFDLTNPEKARTSYQRIMHQHTKQQIEMATNATSRRRSTSPSADSHVPSLASTSSERSRSSVSSDLSS